MLTATASYISGAYMKPISNAKDWYLPSCVNLINVQMYMRGKGFDNISEILHIVFFIFHVRM